MRRKRLLLLILIIIGLVLAPLILHTFGFMGTGERIEFQTISIGIFSGHPGSAYYVIQNAEEWADLWSQHQQIFIPQLPPPEVDFSRMTVIAVFMGQCSTTGYGIEVKEIIDTGLTIIVKVGKTYPGKGCVVGFAITHPYHIVKVCKIDKYVIFETFTSIAECS